MRGLSLLGLLLPRSIGLLLLSPPVHLSPGSVGEVRLALEDGDEALDHAVILRAWPNYVVGRACHPLRNLLVGGRLSRYWRMWTILQAESWVIDTIRWGYRLQLLLDPPFTACPSSSRIPSLVEQLIGLRNAVAILVNKGAMVRLVGPVSPGF